MKETDLLAVHQQQPLAARWFSLASYCLESGCNIVTYDADSFRAEVGDAQTASRPRGTSTPADLYRTTRATPEGSFGPLEPLATLSTAGAEERPVLRGDGRELLFTSARTLRRSTRASIN